MPSRPLAIALVIASAQPAPRPLTPFERAKAESLLRDRLPCLGCHALGAREGGRLAPDLADVGRRRSADYIAAIVDDPQRAAPGSIMPRTPMPAVTRALVVRYLVERTPAAERAAGAPAPSATAAATIAATTAVRATTSAAASATDTSGDRLYARWCAGCHGARGAGDGPNARFLPSPPAVHASAAEMGRRTDDRLYDAIAAGGLPLGRSARMPAFGATLAPAQIDALVRHVRTLCACAPPRWSADGTPRGGGGQ